MNGIEIIHVGKGQLKKGRVEISTYTDPSYNFIAGYPTVIKGKLDGVDFIYNHYVGHYDNDVYTVLTINGKQFEAHSRNDEIQSDQISEVLTADEESWLFNASLWHWHNIANPDTDNKELNEKGS